MDADEIQLILDQARITLNKGRTREAEKFLDKVLNIEPNNEQALNLKGLLLFKEDRYAEAVVTFSKLIEMFPEEATLRTNLGLALLKSEQYVEAEQELKRSLAMGGNPDKINNYLGLVMSGLGRYDEAQKKFAEGGSQKMAEQMLAMMSAGDPPPKLQPSSSAEPSVEDEVGDVFEEAIDKTASVEEYEYDENPDSIISDEPDVISKNMLIPELAAMGNQDVLSVALQALQRRFDAVVETSDLGENLQKLAENLSVEKESEQLWEFPRPGILRVSVDKDPIFIRTSQLISCSGDLSASVQNKKYKGKELATPFGPTEDPIRRIEGSGSLLLEAPEKLTLHSIPIEEELIYIVESAIAGFIGSVKFENGRLPSDDGFDLDLVQFRGTGRIFTLAQDKLLAVPVYENLRFTIAFDKVIGWFGNTIPTLAAPRPPFTDDVRKLVAFKGAGIVLTSGSKVT